MSNEFFFFNIRTVPTTSIVFKFVVIHSAVDGQYI